MNILDKIQSLSLKCLILAWISFWITLALNQFLHITRFYSSLNPDLSDSNWITLGRMCTVVLLSIVLGWKYLSIRTNQQQIPINIWQKMRKLYPALPLLKLLVLLFTNFWFISMTLFFVWVSVDLMIKPLAVLAENFKNYELAEQIYKRLRDKEADLSLASWRTCCIAEDRSVRYARNEAVAKVYGANSLEMIERYIRVGENFDSALQGDYPEQTYYWYKRALRLATSPSVADKAFCALHNMSLVRRSWARIAEEEELLKEACLKLNDNMDISNFGHNRLRRYRNALSCAWGAANQLGDYECAQVFKKQLDKVNRVKPSSYTTEGLMLAIILFGSLMLSLALTVGPFSNWLKAIFVSGLYKSEKKRLSKDSDLVSKLDALNTMMSIDLYRQNLKQAWQHSIGALKLVGMEADTLPNDFMDLSQNHAVKKMFLAQVHATLFLLLFLTFFSKL